MEPEEVDVVGLESSEGVLDGVHEALAVGAAAVGIAGPHVAEPLGGDDESVAGARGAALVLDEVVAEDLLGVSLVVDVGGVDEVAAGVEVAVDELEGLLLLDADAPFGPEGHGAEAEWADAEAGAAEGDVVVELRGHRLSLLAGGAV